MSERERDLCYQDSDPEVSVAIVSDQSEVLDRGHDPNSVMKLTLSNNNASREHFDNHQCGHVVIPSLRGVPKRPDHNHFAYVAKENGPKCRRLSTVLIGQDDNDDDSEDHQHQFTFRRSLKRRVPLAPLRNLQEEGANHLMQIKSPESANNTLIRRNNTVNMSSEESDNKRSLSLIHNETPITTTTTTTTPTPTPPTTSIPVESHGKKAGSPTTATTAKRSMVQEMLEDFPADDDYEFQAKFSQDINMDEIVCLDVGGDRYHIKRGCLTRLPHTRLGRLARCSTLEDAKEFCDIPYNSKPPEYFFDRNGDNFASILDIYRTNMFHLSSIGCALVLQKDLEYWGIDELMMEPCCALKYYPEIEICVNEKQGDLKERRREKEQAEEEDFGGSRWGLVRSWLWNTMEYPWTSKLAQVVAFLSLGMVILSTLTFIISTMEEFQAMDEGESEYTSVVVILDYIDTFVIVFFTFEYLIRFVCCPRKWRFFKNPMNMVDLFSIIPFYVSIFLNTLEDIQIIGKAGKIVRLIRVMRILRIFKLVRHFAGLQSLFLTLRQAYKELGLLMLLVAVAILTFSSLVYFAEKEASEDSWTFVESFWWGLMTITTVGYDLNPKTFLGKLLGGFCALSGIFILTLPIPIVVNSFASYYKNRLWRNEVAQKKRERAQAQAVEAKEMQKFYILKAMAMPMTGLDIDAPNEAVALAGLKAARGLRH